MQLAQKVTRRLKLGQKLRQASEEAAAVATALEAALHERPLIAAESLHELVTRSPLVTPGPGSGRSSPRPDIGSSCWWFPTPDELDRKRVRVVTTFDRSAFFGRSLSLSS